VQKSDGRRFWASLMLTPLKDINGTARGFAVSIRDVTERRTLEQEVVDISEREQQRIGHDLHDGLGQQLTGIAMLATALSEQLETNDKPDPQSAERIADLIHDAIAQTRVLARGLYPIDLQDEGLAYGLQRLSDRVAILPGVKCRFEAVGAARVDTASASHLYRIAQEAINNAIRHGKAKHIAIELRALEDDISLTIRDDGNGFDPASESTGLGLRLMRYRARTIRGALYIQSSNAGTVVGCTLQRSDHR
jgi:signal transduction histidine kinase